MSGVSITPGVIHQATLRRVDLPNSIRWTWYSNACIQTVSEQSRISKWYGMAKVKRLTSSSYLGIIFFGLLSSFPLLSGFLFISFLFSFHQHPSTISFSLVLFLFSFVTILFSIHNFYNLPPQSTWNDIHTYSKWHTHILEVIVKHGIYGQLSALISQHHSVFSR